MPSNLTEVAIYNMALDLLEEEHVTATTDNTSAARWLNRNYAPSRDALLRAHPWNFSMARAALPSLPSAPLFGWVRSYQVPDDALRVLPLTTTGELDAPRVPYRKEGDRILTDAEPPLRVVYVRRTADPHDFDILFGEALSAYLAAKMAHLVTGKQSYAQRMRAAYEDAIDTARLVDSLEGGTPDRPIDDEYERARFSF